MTFYMELHSEMNYYLALTTPAGMLACNCRDVKWSRKYLQGQTSDSPCSQQVLSVLISCNQKSTAFFALNSATRVPISKQEKQENRDKMNIFTLPGTHRECTMSGSKHYISERIWRSPDGWFGGSREFSVRMSQSLVLRTCKTQICLHPAKEQDAKAGAVIYSQMCVFL